MDYSFIQSKPSRFSADVTGVMDEVAQHLASVLHVVAPRQRQKTSLPPLTPCCRRRLVRCRLTQRFSRRRQRYIFTALRLLILQALMTYPSRKAPLQLRTRVRIEHRRLMTTYFIPLSRLLSRIAKIFAKKSPNSGSNLNVLHLLFLVPLFPVLHFPVPLFLFVRLPG